MLFPFSQFLDETEKEAPVKYVSAQRGGQKKKKYHVNPVYPVS